MKNGAELENEQKKCITLDFIFVHPKKRNIYNAFIEYNPLN